MTPEEEARWQRRVDRQRQRVDILETIVEDKTRELFLLNEQLRQSNEQLEQQVIQRTADLQEALIRAEASSEAKTAFLAQMSHELRTPLHGLIGTIDVLKRTALDERQETLIQIAERSGEHLLRVIGDVLDFARLEGGHLELEQAPFSLTTLAEDMMDMFAATAGEKGLPLVVQLPDPAPQLQGDAHRLRQVLANLLSNALKFTRRGRITLRIQIPPAPRTTDDVVQVVWQIIDTGEGISADRLESIFAPFAQAEAATTRRFGGTGLGLAICRRIVEAMGGTLAVTSAPGRGSTFTATTHHRRVTTPSQSTPPPALPPTVAPPVVAHRVLLVDDNAINRTIGEMMLSSLGCKVTLASDGKAALDAVAQATQPPDLILMDCHMPGMSGIETTIALRSRGHTGPVVALTADVSTENHEAVLAAGMQALLGKPYQQQDLLPFLQGIPSPAAAAEPLPPPPAQPVLLDDAQALAMMRGRADRVVRLRTIFLQQLPESLTHLQTAADRDDADAIRRAAHSLRGAAGAICALRLQEQAAALEHSPTQAAALLPTLLQTAHDTAALLPCRIVEE